MLILQLRSEICQFSTRNSKINVPLRVGRIALRKAFGDRQPRLVGRQRPWTIPLRHQHITLAIKPPAFRAWILGSLGLLNHREKTVPA